MKTCKDCLHYEVCAEVMKQQLYIKEVLCGHKKLKLSSGPYAAHLTKKHNIAACDTDILPVLEKAIDLMSEQKIYKITLGVSSGGVVDIKATSSGKISIQRSVALKQKREIE